MLKQTFFILFLISLNLQGFSQKNESSPTWSIGLVGGANFNSFKGYTSALNYDINASPAFGKGHGVGGYFAGLIEYHPKSSVLGLTLQQGADSRWGTFKENGNKLEAKISYFTIEPGLLIQPVRSHFYLVVGPRLGLLWSTRFTYKEPNSPEYPQKRRNPEAYIKNVNKTTASMHVGIGYDFKLASITEYPQLTISPFITYLPSLGRNLRTIEKLELNTLRAGIILKAGFGGSRN